MGGGVLEGEARLFLECDFELRFDFEEAPVFVEPVFDVPEVELAEELVEPEDVELESDKWERERGGNLFPPVLGRPSLF